jgi:beta-hydroxylase
MATLRLQPRLQPPVSLQPVPAGESTPAPYPSPFRRPFPIEELLDLGQKTLTAYNHAVARWSSHGNHTFFEPSAFPWVRRVEADWQRVRAELDLVLREPDQVPEFSEISPDQVHLTAPGNWKCFFLLAYGVRAEGNCARCPETMRVLSRIPGLQTAFFSILAPGAHLRPHHGPFGGVLRYHLALEVPEPRSGCRIRVGEEVRSWEEGRSLVFDDTYEHEAWNDTAGRRVVLFVDFERPLPRLLKAINQGLLWLVSRSPMVQDGIRRYEAWTEKHLHPAAPTKD